MCVCVSNYGLYGARKPREFLRKPQFMRNYRVLCICVTMWMCVCVCVCAVISISVCSLSEVVYNAQILKINQVLCVRVYMYKHIYMYIYIYTQIYMHTHTYLHINSWVSECVKCVFMSLYAPVSRRRNPNTILRLQPLYALHECLYKHGTHTVPAYNSMRTQTYNSMRVQSLLQRAYPCMIVSVRRGGGGGEKEQCARISRCVCQ